MVDASTTQQGIPVEQYILLDEDKFYEVVDGRIVEGEVTAGFNHLLVSDNLYDMVKHHVRKNRLGYFFTDGLNCILERDADGNVLRSRIPDLCFISLDAMPANFDRNLPFPGAPTLAVEVVSPSERSGNIEDKIDDYLRAGTEQVWVIQPSTQRLYQHITGEDSIRVYSIDDVLTAPTLFDDLKIPVAALFADDL
ncbi:MAG: Uma2 family endonuclease [Chloroflexota bacterium]